MNKHEEKTEILLAYALSALSDGETRECAEQVAADAELAAELEHWHEVASHLSLIAERAEPSDLCREKILAAVKNVELTVKNQNVDYQTNDSFEVRPAQQQQPSDKTNVLQFPARERKSFLNYLPTTAAVAASLIAALLGISLYNATRSNALKNDQLAVLNERVAQTERKLNETQGELDRERQERDFLASPASIVTSLDGTKDMPTAKARLVFDRETGRAFLYVENLPNAPQGKAYQIWWITDPKHPAPGGVFETDASGKGVLRDKIPAEYSKPSTIFAVTLEPAGGSQNPSSAPVLITKTL